MDTIIFPQGEAEASSITFHPAPGSTHTKEQDKFAFVLQGVPAAVSLTDLAKRIEETAECQLVKLNGEAGLSKLISISTVAKSSKYRSVKGVAGNAADLIKLNRQLPGKPKATHCLQRSVWD